MGEIIPRPNPPVPLAFTGERLTSAYGGQTEIEHLHRYLLAREWCRCKDVLDVASGEGYGTALLAQVARRTVGVDIAHDAVDHATAAYAQDGLDYVTGDARALPIADASCDVVVSFETIEHLAGPERFLDEVRRVLRPGGLLIVSTPDRDNYSPADSPANQYHVHEFTGAEFEALLRTRFAVVSTLLQRPVFGSLLLPATDAAAAPLCFERRGAHHFEASVGLARPQYRLAFASDDDVATVPPSVYIDTGRLGTLTPSAWEAKLAAAQDAASAERSEAHAAELRAMQQRLTAATAREAALAAELDRTRADLAAALGEAKGLLVANQMAERACAVLSNDLALAGGGAGDGRTAQGETQARLAGQVAWLEAALASARDEAVHAEAAASAERRCLEAALLGARDEAVHAETAAAAERRCLEAELLGARDRLARSEARLADTLVSHSWRVTAPLRRLSLMLYRRA